MKRCFASFLLIFQPILVLSFSPTDFRYGSTNGMHRIVPPMLPSERTNHRYRIPFSMLKQSPEGPDDMMKSSKSSLFSLGSDDEMFNIKTTIGLVGGQSALVAIAVAIAAFLKTPNFGFGPGIDVGVNAIAHGLLMTLPLAIFAWLLDQIEENVPALQDVTTATQRSVLALLGSTYKPGIGLLVAVSLGLAAGFGEEILFRGVLQYELMGKVGSIASIGVSSVIFGLLHAVTPMYAFLATIASFYFGYLYIDTGNLIVPIVTHAIYDVGALMYAHWTVARLSPEEQISLANWVGPNEKSS